MTGDPGPWGPASAPFKMMALWCWYRGAGFHGYQAQQGVRTVQGELLRAFASAGFSRNPVVGGRTDKHVSARMQVLSARLERAQPLEEVAARLNAHLPDDVGIHLVAPCQTGFHAAFRATSKEYRYQLSLAEAGDLDRLREAAACVPGTRNFKVFHFKTSLEQPRTVSTVEVLTSFGGVTLRFVGAGFARYMVRMLVGGLTAVARGETPLEVFCAGLTRGEAFHCPTAAPEPLTLWSIGYPSECDPFTPAQRAAFVWPPAA